MTKLTKEEVLKIAKLSRLKLSDDELAKFQIDLSSIINFVERLNDADLSGLEPTIQVTGLSNVTRADEIVDYGVSRADLLKNAPMQKDGYIRVRRML